MLAAALASAAGAAYASPRMSGFEEIAARSERLDMTGVGWGRSGRFKLGEAVGTFRRDLDRRRSGTFPDDPVSLVEHAGGVSFELTGPRAGGRLAGRCGLDQAQERVRAGALSVSTSVEPMRMRCAFDVDGRPAGELELDAAFSRRVSVETARAGVVRMGGVELAVRAVHRFQNSGWPTSTPLGYTFEQDGKVLGAVDVNGGRKRLALPADPAARDAVLAASVALSLFWDPGDQD